MSFLPDENHPAANFSTHVWKNDDDDDGINNSYSTLHEAQEAFERLERGGQYVCGGLYKWSPAKDDWDCLDAWPENFDGEDFL